MRRVGICIASLLALGVLVTFVGFPYRYHHESYGVVGGAPDLAELELVIRLVEDASRYLLGAPVQTGGPYRLSVTAYGNKGRDRRLILHSATFEYRDGKALALVDGPHESTFSAREIWIAKIYPELKLSLPFEEGTELRVLLDVSLITTSGEVRRTVEQKFLAKQFSGISLFPLIALLYA